MQVTPLLAGCPWVAEEVAGALAQISVSGKKIELINAWLERRTFTESMD